MCLSRSITKSDAAQPRPDKPGAGRFCGRRLRRLCPLVMLLALTACGPRSWVVVVPDPDGRVGHVEVSTPAGVARISSANQYSVLTDPQTPPSRPALMEASRIHALFGPALAVQPQRPVHFLLHFETGNTQLLPASASKLPEAVESIHDRQSRHVSVIGHADTMGDEEANVALSLRRAQAVKQLLVEAGVDESTVDISSHGESNPIVQTADNVANAENRRVEIVVR